MGACRFTVDDPHVITMVEQIFEHIDPDGTLAPDPPEPLVARKVTLGRPAEA